MDGANARIVGIVTAALLVVSASAFPGASQAQRPDLSGNWELDVEASDDTYSEIIGGAGQDTTHGMTRLERNRLLDRLVQLAQAIDEIEITQTEKDLKIFDRQNNVRIYYLDGDERVRQTPWGASLDVVARWDGPRIAVRTTGREIGVVEETFGLQGRQLVLIIRIENRNFEREILIRNYYDRSE